MFVRQDGPLIEIRAPAKINLHLELLSRRADGYHELETLMAAVSLFDTLRFEAIEASPAIELDCGWAIGSARDARELPPSEQNLVTKALKLLQQRSGCQQGARVSLSKNIPAASGLGGGSSDAAAALVAGNLGWKLNWSRAKLAELSAELGSDIPFFLAKFTTSRMGVCTGRGERVQVVDAPTGWPLVIVRPAEGLSTASVYARCQVPTSPVPASPLVQALRLGNYRALAAGMVNRLEAPASELSASVKKVSEALQGAGCVAQQLSGSGSAHFGLCRNRRHAQSVARRLSAAGVGQAWNVQTI